MNDDWRLRVEFEEGGLAAELTARLEARELEHDLSTEYEDRVIVTHDGPEVFLYADSREQLDRAGRVVDSLAREHGWKVETELRRWHPSAEEWEDPDAPLPSDEAAREAERERLDEREREEAEERGYAEFEVRIDLPSREEAARFEERLRDEGFRPVRRWKFVIVGAADEDEASVLADRIRGEAPEGSQVVAEGSWKDAYSELPHPFAMFGGLGV
jgi:hypothetical protein